MNDEFSEFNESGQGVSFVVVVIGLIVTLLLCLVATGAWAIQQRDSDAATIAQIEATNAAVQIQNSFVTQTVAAMETIAHLPTNTPTPTNTATPVPTNTPVPPTNTPLPTDTPVVKPTETPSTTGEDGSGGGDGSTFETPTPDFSSADNGNSGTVSTGFSTPTPNANGTSTLPQTGVSIWGALSMAFAFLMVLVVARQLRSNL